MDEYHREVPDVEKSQAPRVITLRSATRTVRYGGNRGIFTEQC